MNMALVAVGKRRISHSFERDQNRQSAASETIATLLSHVSPGAGSLFVKMTYFFLVKWRRFGPSSFLG